MHLHSTLLLEHAVGRVADVTCRAPRSGPAGSECASAVQVIVPRRGVFAVHRYREPEPLTVDSARAVVLAAGEEYEVSHPVEGGDRCTSLSLDAGVAEEALDLDVRCVALNRGAQLAIGALPGVLKDADALEAEEAVLLAVGAVAEAAGLPAAPAAGRVAARRVDAARVLLAAAPERRWRLDELAFELHASPFHLARQFRAVTGRTISLHLLGLRLAAVLDRLADGDVELARVALDCGFAHHSHLTARFRASFGVPPSVVRGARPAELRTIVTAAARRQT